MDIPFEDYGDGQTVGAEVRGRYELLPGKLGITAGTEASYNHTKSRAFGVNDDGSEADPAEVTKNFDIEGVYTEVDGQPTKWLGFTAGVRYDRNSAIDQNLSPRAALFLAQPEQYGLKLLYAQGFRNPSAFEAFFYDNTSFEQPKNLGAEKISSYEAVAWAKPIPGLSTRLSGFYWKATAVVEQLPAADNPNLLVFQNTGQFVTAGVEAEASYRDSRGWYGFAGATYAHVGAAEAGSSVAYGSVPDAPAVTAAGGISTPKLFGRFHVSTELTYIGKRPTRPDGDGNASPDARAWYGWNAALYVPNVSGFDITAGVRNLIGTRNMVPAPGDYDRTNPDTLVVPVVPGEGREIYVKVGYSY
jgi:iron complex outermembrane receptor protein